MAWKHIIYPIMTYFRQRRLAELLKAYPDLENYTVLDVGGRPFLWDLLRYHYRVKPKQLVLLNTPSENTIAPSPDYTVKIADGRHLPYPDKSFDLVFSNSVIEHVGDLEDMARFAKECTRVGKEVYIQTPNRWFPLEAHFGAAFVHWLPRAWYQRLSFLSMRYLCAFNNPVEKDYFQQEFDTTRLLSGRQLRELFPQQTIASEKVLGLSKSFIVMSPQRRSLTEAAQPPSQQPAAIEIFGIPALEVETVDVPALDTQLVSSEPQPQYEEVPAAIAARKPELVFKASTVEVQTPAFQTPRPYALPATALHMPVLQEPKLRAHFSPTAYRTHAPR